MIKLNDLDFGISPHLKLGFWDFSLFEIGILGFHDPLFQDPTVLALVLVWQRLRLTRLMNVLFSGTIVGLSPDSLLLSGTVVGENPDHVWWATLLFIFPNSYIINLPTIIAIQFLDGVGENIVIRFYILFIDCGRQVYYWIITENIWLCTFQ